MAIHYVYEDIREDSLCQGDVLSRHPELTTYLETKFPFFSTNKNYKYFLILTQSCDLVCRSGELPKSPYITIAGVRSVEDAIKREARKYQEWWQEPKDIIPTNKYDQLLMFTARLIDNNIQNYFYLHEDSSLDISGKNCAFLAESISINVECYDVCKKARIAHLKETFRAKLGWIVGSMYSRVGTQEWDTHYGKNAANKLASDMLKNLFIKIGKEQIAKGINELKNEKELSNYSPTEIFDHIMSTHIISKYKQFSDRLINLGDSFKIVNPIKSQFVNHLKSNDDLMKKIEAFFDERKDSRTGDIYGQLIQIILSDLDDSFKEESSFPGRDKIIRRIIETIKQDDVVKSLLN